MSFINKNNIIVNKLVVFDFLTRTFIYVHLGGVFEEMPALSKTRTPLAKE